MRVQRILVCLTLWGLFTLADFFNVFNHPMFNNPATSLAEGNYGKITQTLANAGSTQGDITSGRASFS